MNSPNTRPLSTEPQERLQWLALVLTIAISGFYFVVQYHPFILPSVDYLRIRQLTEELVSWQTPSNFKGMPLVSLMIGLLGFMLPASSDPYLHAGLVLNITFSLGNLVLLYLLSREFLSGWLAFIPTMLLMVPPEFTISALQPMLEPTIGFFTLATLVALARNSRWALVYGALASLTRYEMVILIPVIFVVEIWRTPQHWLRHTLHCTAAGLPFVIWFGLSIILQAGGNPYIREMEGMDFNANWNLLWTFHSPFPIHWLIMSVMVGLGWVVGFPVAYSRQPVAALAIALFFILYTLSHIVFGIDRPRYAYPVLWVFPLFITVAVHAIILMGKETVEHLRYRIQIAGIAILAVSVAGWVLLSLLKSSPYEDSEVASASFYFGWNMFILAVLGGAAMLAGTPPVRFGIVAGLLAVGLAALPVINAGKSLGVLTSQKYFEHAEYAVAADWLATNLPQDKITLVTMAHAILYSNPSLSSTQLFAFDDLDAENSQQLIREMDKRGIEYVMFLYRLERPTDESHTNYYRNLHYYLKRKVYLMDPFRHGQPVEGFELVDSIPPPSPRWNAFSYVYRRTPHPIIPQESDNE